MSKQQERIDGVLLSLAGSLEGGVPELFDCLFSFLSRKTDFFTGADPTVSRKMLLDAYEKYAGSAQQVVQLLPNLSLQPLTATISGSRCEAKEEGG